MCRARDVEKQIVPTAAEPLPKSVSWRQISAACANGRKLTVISGQVYDVDAWTQRHPGGKVLLTYTGEDATDACAAFHRDQAFF
ncbi:hypothetical protein T484DRAFT_1778008 [Baffinella frigidus]|nr:hypothetical protein T484DRAFT_1778008 [Cryptophyta sp. CCMP2293]